MGMPFDYAPERPDNIDEILNALQRYDPATTVIFQEYVMRQCQQRTYDCYANLALLKLYQFNPNLLKDDVVTCILAKALTVFPAPDFRLCLALLPPHILLPPSKVGPSAASNNPIAGYAPFSESVQKLNKLNNLLSSAFYSEFWTTYMNDDIYAELTSEIVDFVPMIRIRIANVVSQTVRQIARPVLEGWLNLKTTEFDNFIREACGWSIEGTGKLAVITIPINKNNEAKSQTVREHVEFEQFSRIVQRASEQPV